MPDTLQLEYCPGSHSTWGTRRGEAEPVCPRCRRTSESLGVDRPQGRRVGQRRYWLGLVPRHVKVVRT